MSFSITASGTKEKALEQLANASGSGDTQHFEICRDALKSAIETIPEGGVIQASASGHHDYSANNGTGSFQLSFSVNQAPPQSGQSRQGQTGQQQRP